MEERKVKQAKGITLIALVITIIVLLILAGITISMIIGENRNINKSRRGQKRNRNSRCKGSDKIKNNRGTNE